MIPVLNPDNTASGKFVLEGVELQAAFATVVAAIAAANAKGFGPTAVVPTGTSAAPVAIGNAPAGATGVRVYLATGDVVTCVIAASLADAKTAAAATPPASFSVSVASSGPNWDEDLANGMMVYVIGKTGNPVFRFR